MTSINKIEFLIDHIDPLGQGVYKKDDQIYFIPKTLPTEKGVANVLRSSKGVNFARLERLGSEATNRVESICPHFENCPGCHFLHCDYNSEIEYKTHSFKRMLDRLNTSILSPIKTIEAPQRLHYRNRIQLHYNLKEKALGFIDGKKNRIVQIPQCQIANSIVQKQVEALYKDESWIKSAKKFKKIKGHVEIYDSPAGLKIQWNKRYASGGFTQVNQAMNDKMKELLPPFLEDHSKNHSSAPMLDLFGGDGNLSQFCDGLGIDRVIVDYYQGNKPKGDNYHSLDLYDENSLMEFMVLNPNSDFHTMIIDPPRKGFPDLSKWTDKLSPEKIVYISCHPQTMIRDLRNLGEDYEIEHAYILDLFPSTYHFEALTVLKKRNK